MLTGKRRRGRVGHPGRAAKLSSKLLDKTTALRGRCRRRVHGRPLHLEGAKAGHGLGGAVVRQLVGQLPDPAIGVHRFAGGDREPGDHTPDEHGKATTQAVRQPPRPAVAHLTPATTSTVPRKRPGRDAPGPIGQTTGHVGARRDT